MRVGFVKISESDFEKISDVKKANYKRIKELYLDESTGQIIFVMEDNKRRVENNNKICYNIHVNKNEREENPFLEGMEFDFNIGDLDLENELKK